MNEEVQLVLKGLPDPDGGYTVSLDALIAALGKVYVQHGNLPVWLHFLEENKDFAVEDVYLKRLDYVGLAVVFE